MPKICIDPGHGGTDPGAVNGARYEKDDVLRLGKAVANRLRQQGIEVVMTREKDLSMPISSRCSVANQANCDYILSLHRDAAGPSASGISVWIYSAANDKSLRYAEEIYRQALAVTPTLGRGVHKGTPQNFTDFGINSGTNMPSALIELGFITNEIDNDRFDNYFEQYIEAITKGLCQAVGVTYCENNAQGQQPRYRVQLGAFANKENARYYCEEVRKKGLPAFVVEL